MDKSTGSESALRRPKEAVSVKCRDHHVVAGVQVLDGLMYSEMIPTIAVVVANISGV